MSCHQVDEAPQSEEGGAEVVHAVTYASSVYQPNDDCHCQYSQYIGVSLVRPVVRWDEYLRQVPKVTAIPLIGYVSRFHSEHQSQPDTPPPKV